MLQRQQQCQRYATGHQICIFIFASMGLFNLCENGEMVYIIPRSWTSGAYFKRFREYFLTVGKLEHIHLFCLVVVRYLTKRVYCKKQSIIKVRKTDKMPETVTITSSKSNSDFGEITSLTVPYDFGCSWRGLLCLPCDR